MLTDTLNHIWKMLDTLNDPDFPADRREWWVTKIQEQVYQALTQTRTIAEYLVHHQP